MEKNNVRLLNRIDADIIKARREGRATASPTNSGNDQFFKVTIREVNNILLQHGIGSKVILGEMKNNSTKASGRRDKPATGLGSQQPPSWEMGRSRY